ncbi:MAG: hypothetical protein ACR2JR_08995 [Rubrobacteraceae bacterium]
MLSTVLLWLDVVSVLGVSLLCSVLFRNVLASLTASLAILYSMFKLPELMVDLFWGAGYNVRAPYDLMWQLTLTTHWTNGALYTGRYFPGVSFLVCLMAAVVPLLAALWLFNRKAY